MDKLYITIPAYNEEENIENVVRSWYKILSFGSPDSRLVIADSGSIDNTHNILLNLQKELDKIIILSDTFKEHGPKLIYMYKYAIDNNADYIFQTDSDGQTDPNEFEKFWNDRLNYDIILGNRRVRGDGFVRKIVECIVCLLLFIIFGIRVPDANAPFRLMKTNIVSKYIDRFNIDYNLPNIMLTCFFKYYNENMKFIDITFSPRKKGVNSINIKKIFNIGIEALSDFGEFRRKM